jgi:RNA polymerase sigma-70 factor, ECF subfamily
MKFEKLENLSDEDLFELFKTKHDKESFDVIYQRYNKKVFAYCLRACVEREKAKDVFQKIFTSVVDKKDSFKGGSFIAWLMIITRNYCLLEKRRKYYYEEVTEETLVNDGDERNDFLLNELVRKEIEKLPEGYKELIKLRYYDDFSYTEIAEMKEWKMSQVKIKLFRAKKMLSKALLPLKELVQ